MITNDNLGDTSNVKWVCVELTSDGERERNIDSIIKSVRQILSNNNMKVFVPAISQRVRDESSTTVFLTGYIFVEYIEGVRYLKLQDTRYFHSVLKTVSGSGTKRKNLYSLLNDKQLDPMRDGVKNLKIAELSVGDTVKVVKGKYKNLVGEVIEVYDDQNVQIKVVLVSKQSGSILIDYPSSYLSRISV
jgi:transcription antitermination factor NusG